LGSFKDSSRILQELQKAIRNHSIDTLIISGVDLEDEKVSLSLEALLQKRTHSWASVSICDDCKGKIDPLISIILEKPAAGIGMLFLDSVSVDNNVAAAVQRGLEGNKARLTELGFRGSALSVASITSVMQGLKHNETMEALTFTNSHFDGVAAFELAKGMRQCPRIKQLDLFSCELSDGVVARLVKSLNGHPSLENLDLGQNYCASNALQAIADMLVSTNTLRKLNLALQHRRLCGDISQVANALARNKTLQVLYLRGNPLNDRGMESLVQSLLHNNTLERLMLTDCELSRNAIQSLLRQLRYMKGLRCLWLNGCQSTAPAARQQYIHIATESLRKNVSLEELYLPFGFDPYRSELNVLLDLNWGGRKLLHGACSGQVPKALWSVILERVNMMSLPGGKKDKTELAKRRANIIYFLLRQQVLLEE
jgi:hypothetical protein